MEKTIPVNEEGVDSVLAVLGSGVTQNLVRIAVATARMQFIRQAGQSEEDWRNQLPIEAFDMGFFARVLAKAFADEHVLKAILNGASVEEATGWDL